MKKISVGVADDNRDYCDLISDYFSGNKEIEISFVANDGIKTIDSIKKYNPEVLILDMVMPRLDGVGVLEEMNSIEMDSYPKIIVLSAVGQEAFTKKAISLGADYYLVKPLDMKLLEKRIRQVSGKEQSVNDNNKLNMSKGIIKWFNNEKGYGFINGSVDEDIFVHYTAIKQDGYKTLSEGQVVEFNLIKTDKGLQATDVKTVNEKELTTIS